MNFSQQRGSILIYSLMTMAVMLSIGLALSGLFVSKLRAAAAARNAMVSLYAADSAGELCLYEAWLDSDDAPMVMGNGAGFSIADSASGADVTTDCSVLGSASFGFRVTGTYRGTSRTLEISQ